MDALLLRGRENRDHALAAQGRRPIDPGTGDQGGMVEGIFEAWWAGDVLYGRNNAVGDSYLFGWSCDPRQASDDATNPDRSNILFWHADYHPDGGQLFFPQERKPFIAPLALPGDEVTPTDFMAFYFDGTCGLYIHPGIWMQHRSRSTRERPSPASRAPSTPG